MGVRVIHADSREALGEFADASIDSCVTDPPYALVSIGKRFGADNAAPCKEGKTGAYARASKGFMGKRWDTGETAFDPSFWAQVLRVLKPGSHLIAFGGTRTYHRLACAIEDAGFVVRDAIMWHYGSGFPKSHSLTGKVDGFDGWGTALKPATEIIVLARKPLIGTVAANVMKHGTGALNIDGCRIEAADEPPAFTHRQEDSVNCYGNGKNGSNRTGETTGKGRWPANVIHDGSEEVLRHFPETQSGSGAVKRESAQGYRANAYGAESRTAGTPMISHADGGSAARFFYTAKADADDRLGSKHPTVKPVDLMAYLCRLITPPGGTVLDPFAGSGTTGMACMREGFNAILIEREAEYIADIHRRLAHVKGADTPLFAGSAA